MKKPVLLLLGALLVSVSLLSACSSDDDGDSTAEATATTASETATATEAATETTTAEASATTAAGAEGTATDLLGREVTVASPPERIVTLSPSAIEILYAVGGEAVGRSTTAVHPEGVESLEDIGPSYQPNFEAVLALDPDLVIADASAQAHLLDQITAALGDVPVVFVGAVVYDDVATSMGILGQLLGKQTEAEAAIAEMEAAKADAEAAAADQTPPKVLIIDGAPDDFFVALPDSWPGSLVEVLGGENVAASQPAAGPFPGYTQLSLEAILASEADVILAITLGPPGATLSQGILGETAYADLPAVQNGRVHEIDAEVFLQAPGPRAADGLRELAEYLYPAAR
ncbi:MAG: ABC transporter substrate-binding protein [Dehalococcoidia bacterium]